MQEKHGNHSRKSPATTDQLFFDQTNWKNIKKEKIVLIHIINYVIYLLYGSKSLSILFFGDQARFFSYIMLKNNKRNNKLKPAYAFKRYVFILCSKTLLIRNRLQKD